MKPSTLLILYIIFVLAGCGGLAYYHFKTPDVDFISRDFNERILEIDGLNSSVSELALRSRINLDSNYDMLLQSVNELKTSIQDLESVYFNDSAVNNELLSSRFTGLSNSLVNKIDLIENFKAHNSVLRNSEKYAPIVGRQLIEIAESKGLNEIAKLYGEIVFSVFEFGNQPRGETNDELLKMISDIPSTESRMPEDKLSLIIEFQNHVSKAVEEKGLTDSYLNSALSTNSENQLDELSKVWRLHLGEIYEVREQFFIAMLVYIGFLLLFTGYIGFRLRGLYVSLDGEVALRTEEVKKAYEELSQSEKQLMQSEKMASLGQLVAGVAHEINTPLGYITCNLDTVRDNMEDFKIMLKTSQMMGDIITTRPLDKAKLSTVIKRNVIAFKEITKRGTISGINQLLADSTYGLNEISQLVSSLKDFSRLDTQDIVKADIHHGLDATIKVCGNIIGDRKLIKAYDSNMPEIECMPAQLNQVFMNVITNAAQAVDPQSGVIKVETKAEADSVKVVITDNGVGMDEDVISRMFDPFFTTKDVNEGTGLGLSIAYKIIKSHRGEVLVDSKVGSGTQITLRFPVSQDSALAADE